MLCKIQTIINYPVVWFQLSFFRVSSYTMKIILINNLMRQHFKMYSDSLANLLYLNLWCKRSFLIAVWVLFLIVLPNSQFPISHQITLVVHSKSILIWLLMSIFTKPLMTSPESGLSQQPNCPFWLFLYQSGFICTHKNHLSYFKQNAI